ncbi:hypothetical protein CRW16_21780 [Salmonella enterica subsp. enterica serovar Saintpaul]|nr:hypothetical protein [Salmonella enterica subsp. enterica serovar Saintpaul]
MNMKKEYSVKKITHYLNRPLLLWCGLLLTFCVIQLLLGRNNREAVKFFLAAFLCGGVHFFFTKNKKQSLISLVIFLIPSLCIAIYAAVIMPKETSAGDYTEIEMGLKYAKTDTNRHEILLAVIDAMNDGKISQWESQHLIHFIFSINGFLMRTDPARSDAVTSTEAAKENLNETVNQLKPVIVYNTAKISDDGVYTLIDSKGECKYILKIQSEAKGKVTAYKIDITSRQCGDEVLEDNPSKLGSLYFRYGYLMLPIEAGTPLYLFK